MTTPSLTSCIVTVNDEQIAVENLVLTDEDCASFLQQQDPELRPEVCRRALKVGLLSLRDTEMVSRVDFTFPFLNSMRYLGGTHRSDEKGREL